MRWNCASVLRMRKSHTAYPTLLLLCLFSGLFALAQDKSQSEGQRDFRGQMPKFREVKT